MTYIYQFWNPRISRNYSILIITMCKIVSIVKKTAQVNGQLDLDVYAVLLEIADEQSGFRANCLCVDQAFVLYHVIYDHLERGEKVYVVFVDVRKAYDRVHKSLLHWKMRKKRSL